MASEMKLGINLGYWGIGPQGEDAVEIVQAADVVVTMGCGDACPIVPGPRYLDWPVPDPRGAPIAIVRQIRDDIDAHITDLLNSLPTT